MKENKNLLEEIQQIKADTPEEEAAKKSLETSYERSVYYKDGNSLAIVFTYPAIIHKRSSLMMLADMIESLHITRVSVNSENYSVMWELIIRGWKVTRAYEDELVDWPGEVKLIELERSYMPEKDYVIDGKYKVIGRGTVFTLTVDDHEEVKYFKSGNEVRVYKADGSAIEQKVFQISAVEAWAHGKTVGLILRNNDKATETIEVGDKIRRLLPNEET